MEKNNKHQAKQRKPLELEIKIKYFDENYPPLEDIAVGDLIDLRSRERIEYKKGDSFIIPLGVAMHIPNGWRADVSPRSSTFKKWGIIQTNSTGKIDNSFSGDEDEWGLPVYALNDGVIEKFDRVCQFEVIKKQPKIKFNTVKSLNNPSRGGFGSTGTK
ncbi:dUTP diphosphatase [Cytobacillus praedii]|uniref:dUTP diphosphatase n=1 Tax=Cytobacillus praedii TaxID=1742358 RepID=UPI001F61CE90|nr:deoxyuridine 5'-triphosphate nucleotidohydrolase [Cytobacillus praedii]